MKLSSELRDLPVVSIAEGEEVGLVRDFIFSPAKGEIVGLVVETPDLYLSGAKVVSFSLIHSIGNYAVTVENNTAVVGMEEMPEFQELMSKRVPIIGSKVITKGGRMIGYISEFAIDQHSGKVLGYELTTDLSLKSPDGNSVIPFDKVITVGRDVLVVTDDVQESLADGFESLAGALGTEGLAVERERIPVPQPKPAVSAASKQSPPVESKPAPKPAAVEQVAESADIFEPAPAPAPVKKPEPAPAKPAAKPAAAKEEGSENLSDIFERRQINYMMGKKVSKDIIDDVGAVAVKKGTVIDDSVIKKAKAANKFMELSMSIEIED